MRFASILSLAVLIAACDSSATNDDGGVGTGTPTDSRSNANPIGKTADGHTAATKADAWPNAPADDFPTYDVIATGCVAIAACLGNATSVGPTELDVCFAGVSYQEERVVAASSTGARDAFVVRAAAAAGGDCRKVPNPSMQGSSLVCEEIGCYWLGDQPIPTVTCAGTVATLATGGVTYVRDCATAYATCDATSPTGCTDRQPVACEHPAADACDGTVRLGCDGSGHVSYHECAWNGGTCGPDANGTNGCLAPAATCSDDEPGSCDGDVLVACMGGQPVRADCTPAGMRCVSGACVKEEADP